MSEAPRYTGRMGWFSDVFGGLLGRDPPALPGPAEERRADSAGGGSVMNPLTGLGSWADKGASARPNPCVVPLRDDELRALYGHNGLARRIVDLPPGRATRRGWTVTDIPQSEDKRLRTWERHREGWSMADLYGGAVLLMVTEDDVPRSARGMSPSAWLMQPLDLRRIGVLHAIHVFDAFEASPASWENDIASPGWRLPGSWSLSSSTGWSATVHASRVVHLRGRRRPPSEIRGWVSSNA
ncbi:MAG TPA: anti-CBASS Acb1 family protein, partial [Candidatus Limnocylindria bacterium]|nr:anti-CBASS Acb1 family protein [Candidatus Limnocylindria bacterium]